MRDLHPSPISCVRWAVAECLLLGITLGVARCAPLPPARSVANLSAFANRKSPIPLPTPPLGRSSGQASHPAGQTKFFASLPPAFQVPKTDDEVGRRILACYGAGPGLARGGTTPPPVLVFPNRELSGSVADRCEVGSCTVGGTVVELQVRP